MPMSMVVSAAWPLVVVRAVVIVVVWMVVVVGVVVVRRGGTVDVPALIAAAVRFGGERPSQRGWRRRGQIAGDPAQIVRTRAAIVRQHRSHHSSCNPGLHPPVRGVICRKRPVLGRPVPSMTNSR